MEETKEEEHSHFMSTIFILRAKVHHPQSDVWSVKDNPEMELNTVFHETGMLRDGWGG